MALFSFRRLIVCVGLLCCGALSALDFEAGFQANAETLWKLSEADFARWIPALESVDNKGRSVLRVVGAAKGKPTEKFLFGGREVSDCTPRFENGKLSGLVLTVRYPVGDMESDRDEKRERDRFSGQLRSLNPVAPSAQCFRVLFQDGKLLNTVCFRGRYADVQLGTRPGDRDNGGILTAAFFPVGALDKAASGEVGRSFEAFLSGGEKPLFERTPEDVKAFFNDRFEWLDADQTRLRCASVGGNGKIRFVELPVQEAIFTFREGRLDAVSLSLFNQGDGGKTDRGQLDAWRESARTAGSALCGGQEPKSKSLKLDGDTKMTSLNWTGTDFDLTLKWDETKRKSSFLSLDVSRPGASKDVKKALSGGAVNARDLKARVKADSDGAVQIDVPMVDQGGKGYCTAATVSRVLQYYGIEADQYLLARLGNVDTEKGASLGDVCDMISSFRSKSRIQYAKLYQAAGYRDSRALERLLSDYNKQVKKTHRGERDTSVRLVFARDGAKNSIDLYATLANMYYADFKALRLREGGGAKTLERHVMNNISKGIPVIWGVLAIGKGSLPIEGKLEQVSGHLRLIVGYNPKMREIIYSDSWGAGHEAKSMPLDDAWAITTSIFTITPR